jgi:hypothetical protein
MIDREWDEDGGIITVTASGVWTKADVEEHYRALRRMIDAVREAGRPIRVLSDITQASRQSPIVEAHTLGEIDRTYQRGDRVAFLTANAEDKAYTKMILGKADAAIFSSRMAAEMWLSIEDEGQL